MVNELSLRNIAMPIDWLMFSTKNDADIWRHVYVKYIWRTEGKGLSMSPKIVFVNVAKHNFFL